MPGMIPSCNKGDYMTVLALHSSTTVLAVLFFAVAGFTFIWMARDAWNDHRRNVRRKAYRRYMIDMRHHYPPVTPEQEFERLRTRR